VDASEKGKWKERERGERIESKCGAPRKENIKREREGKKRKREREKKRKREKERENGRNEGKCRESDK